MTGEAGPVPDDVQLNEFGDVYVLSITEEVPLGYIDPKGRAAVADELRQAAAVAILGADYDWTAEEAVWDAKEQNEAWALDMADAVLSVPGIADALARDAKVAEIVAKWASGRNEPWPLTVALEVADAIAALYPEAGK